MEFYNMNLKNNRYLPFIIIVVVLLLLLIVNIVTSKSKHTYTKNDIKFTYDSDTQSTVVENNVSSSSSISNETQIEDTQSVENTQSSVEETYYEDTQAEDEQTSDEELDTDIDTDVEPDSETETKLFSSNEQLENIALGYLNQGRKYRKFFKSKELFEKGTNLGFDVSKLKSSDLKHNSVTFSGYYDSGDSSDILEVLVIQFKVENNKITGVTIK